MANYKGSEKEIILCGDNDAHKEYSHTHALLEKTQEVFEEQGKQTSIIKPTYPGDDFNDVLKKERREGVQAYFKSYLLPLDQAEGRPSSPIEGDPEKQKPSLKPPFALDKTTIRDRRSDPLLSYQERFRAASKHSEPSSWGRGNSPTIDIPAIAREKESSLDTIADYLHSQLKDIRIYEGTSLEDKARETLRDYLHTLQKNDPLFKAIMDHHRNLAKEIEQFQKEQNHEHFKDYGLER